MTRTAASYSTSRDLPVAIDGKAIRLGRLLDPASKRTLIVAFAHGVLMGSLPGIRTLDEIATSASALGEADGVLITPGLVRHIGSMFAQPKAPSMLMLIDWQNISRTTEQLGYDAGVCEPLAAVEEAVALGADGVMTYLYLGYIDPHDEAREIRRNVEVARECRRLGLVHIIESRAIRNEKLSDGSFDPALIGLHTRIAAEIGADMVKTKYTGTSETFAGVVQQCPAPIVIAGGARKDDFEESLAEVRGAIQAGAAGVMYGRNIYQQTDIISVLQRFRDAVSA